MRFIHTDHLGNPVGDGTLHGITSAKRTRSTDGTDTLTLTLTGAAGSIEQGDTIISLDSMGRVCEHTATAPETTRNDTTPTTTVTCTTSLTELQLKAIPWLTLTGGAQSMLHAILDGTRWTAGTVEADGATTATETLKNTNALAALQTIANDFNLEIDVTRSLSEDRMHVTGRTVNLRARTGSDTGRRVSYGRDLTGIRRTVSATRPITRLYVYGKSAAGADEGTDSRATIADVNGGKPYIDADQTTLNAYGLPGPDGGILPAEGTVEFPDVSDPGELLRLGRAELARRSRPTVTYAADAIALDRAGMNVDGIDLGDTVQVVDTTFPTPLRLEARVLKIEEDLLDTAAATTLTFGNITETLTSQSRRVQATVQRLWSGSGAWDDAANLTGGYVAGVIAGLNTQMNKTGGYTYLTPGEGIYVYDRPKDENPTQVIQIGGGSFRIANSRKSDGTWAWRTMGTGAGLVADTIIAGMLRGGSSWWNLDTGEVRFDDGIIRSADSSTYWNLGTGQFQTNGTITGGTITGTDITGGTITGNEIHGGRIYGTIMDQSTVSSSVVQKGKAGSSFISDDGNDWIKFDAEGFSGIQLYAAGAHLDLSEDGFFQLMANNTDSRVDATADYVALAKGELVDACHVMAFSDKIVITGHPDIYFEGNVHGLPTTSQASENPALQSALMAAADQGVDLSDPDSELTAPSTVEELTNTQLHAILRLLVDGHQTEARELLDDYQAEQRVWTRQEIRDLTIGSTATETKENTHAQQTR